MIHLNIITLTELCFYFGKVMKKKKNGFILNIASIAAYQPNPYLASYGASKSYVLNFSEALSKELEDYNIKVTCLSPGTTDTAFFTEANITNTDKGFFAKKGRMSPVKVAETGIKALFHNRLSVVPGLKNKLFAISNRFATRKMIANISKMLTKN